MHLIWIARILMSLRWVRSTILWLAVVLPVINQIIGWVQRIWDRFRDTFLGRLLRLAGAMSVLGALSGVIMVAILKFFSGILYFVFPSIPGWTFPFGGPVHFAFGLVCTLIDPAILVSCFLVYMYVSIFVVIWRTAKWLASTTLG